MGVFGQNMVSCWCFIFFSWLIISPDGATLRKKWVIEVGGFGLRSWLAKWSGGRGVPAMPSNAVLSCSSNCIVDANIEYIVWFVCICNTSHLQYVVYGLWISILLPGLGMVPMDLGHPISGGEMVRAKWNVPVTVCKRCPWIPPMFCMDLTWITNH